MLMIHSSSDFRIVLNYKIRLNYKIFGHMKMLPWK